MSDIADYLHPVDPSLKVLFLIGRDIPEAHHVIEQRIGPPRSPFAQRSPLGWTIIGDVCLSGYRIGKVGKVAFSKLLLNTILKGKEVTENSIVIYFENVLSTYACIKINQIYI